MGSISACSTQQMLHLLRGRYKCSLKELRGILFVLGFVSLLSFVSIVVNVFYYTVSSVELFFTLLISALLCVSATIFAVIISTASINISITSVSFTCIMSLFSWQIPESLIDRIIVLKYGDQLRLCLETNHKKKTFHINPELLSNRLKEIMCYQQN